MIVNLDDPTILIKSYKVRTTGQKGQSIETTIPREIFDREAKRLGLSFEEALKLLRGVWRYGGFHGILLTFEVVSDDQHQSAAVGDHE